MKNKIMWRHLSLSTVACNTCRMNWNEAEKNDHSPLHALHIWNLGCDVTPLVQREYYVYWNSAISWICTTKKGESKRSELLIYYYYFWFVQECRRQTKKMFAACFHHEFECGRCSFSWDSMVCPPFLCFFIAVKTVWLALHRHTVHTFICRANEFQHLPF